MNTEATYGPKQNPRFNAAHVSINSGVNIGGVHANKYMGATSDTNHLDYLSAPGESFIMPTLPTNSFGLKSLKKKKEVGKALNNKLNLP